MYLYDPRACRYNLHASKSIHNLHLSNETSAHDVLPIQWIPALTTVSTRISAKTRNYIKLSAIIHVFWLLVALALRLIRNSTELRPLKIVLATAFYATVFVVVFDLSMAIVYIAHIQQSLTKGMILRYSGWSVDMEIKNYNDFGGWFPIVASICWLRGVVILGLNIYSCRVLQLIQRRVQKREEKSRLALVEHGPIPEPNYDKSRDYEVLYYSSGEHEPSRLKYRPMMFF